MSVIESTTRKRTEQKVAEGLYRTLMDGTKTNRYRYARMKNGVSVFKRFEAATVGEAKSIASKLRADLDVHGPTALGDRTVTVEALAEAFLVYVEGPHGKLAPNTVAQRKHLLRCHVVPALGPKLKAADVTPAHLRQLVSKLERKRLAGASIRACVASASGMFSYGVRIAGCIPRNPVRDLERGDLPSAKRTSEPRYLSVEQVERVLAHLSNEFRPLAATLFYGALRVSEALALTWGDVDAEAHVVRVRGTKTAASDASVPLLSQLARELAAHRERQAVLGFERIKPEALIFQTVSGLSPGRRNAHRAISQAAKRAGLQPDGAEPVGPHDLRHSMASAAFGLGLTPVEVSRLLRHASPAVTLAVYSALTDDQAAALGGKLAAIGGA